MRENESANDHPQMIFLEKAHPGKNLFLSYGHNNSRPIRMQHSLNYNIWRTSWSMKLNFLQKQQIHAVISSGCGQVIVSGVISTASWVIKFGFCL